MTKLTNAIFDAQTGQMQIVDFTPDEIVAHEQMVAESKKQEEARIAIYESARAKLKALGLTDDEINALVG